MPNGRRRCRIGIFVVNRNPCRRCTCLGRCDRSKPSRSGRIRIPRWVSSNLLIRNRCRCGMCCPSRRRSASRRSPKSGNRKARPRDNPNRSRTRRTSMRSDMRSERRSAFRSGRSSPTCNPCRADIVAEAPNRNRIRPSSFPRHVRSDTLHRMRDGSAECGCSNSIRSRSRSSCRPHDFDFRHRTARIRRPRCRSTRSRCRHKLRRPQVRSYRGGLACVLPPSRNRAEPIRHDLRQIMMCRSEPSATPHDIACRSDEGARAHFLGISRSARRLHDAEKCESRRDWFRLLH